ncbi:hypothetical protein ACMHYB_01580 [Sorangium sp. So ce1128]
MTTKLGYVTESEGANVDSWKVSTKRGTQSGVGVSVSGAGAYAKLKGTMTFKLQHLDSSKTYDRMKTAYSIGGGVAAFFSWIGIKANASMHKEEIHEVFKEVSNSQSVDGKAKFDLYVSGLYPNVEASASAYVLVLEIQDSSGNTYHAVSSGDPSSDTGAQDQGGNKLPKKDNESTIEI